MTTTKTLTDLTPKDIMSAYSGKDGKCCCGCSGKHYTSSHATAPRSPINDKMVNKILRILQAAPANEVDNMGSCISTVIGTRLYIIYLD